MRFFLRRFIHSRNANKPELAVNKLNLEELSRRIRRTRNLEELSQLREDLYRLRRRAFHELVAERIAADESFTIFQDFLGQELREVDRWLDRGGSPGQARKRSG